LIISKSIIDESDKLKTASDLTLNWANYIKDTFFVATEKSTPVDFTTYLFLLEHHFDLKKINVSLDKEITGASSDFVSIQPNYFRNKTGA
jgi:hypothetical protein